MIKLEQVQLLESRVSKAVEYVQHIKAENAALISEKEGLKAKLEINQKRIDELEILVMRFKEDQGRIEDGIISALDRLSQFEEAFEKSLKGTKEKNEVKKTAAKPREKTSEVYFEIPREKQQAEVLDTSEEEDSDDLLEDTSDTSGGDSIDDTSSDDTSMEGELDIF